MGNIFDRRYYEERLERNRTLAQQSRDPAIRSIHLDYVRLYEHMLVSDKELAER
ncbi:hypothetical protein WG908_01780 [Sphingobium sp. AN641]|uniref:hypothetical protein n=1 Tax=Sphingobium sp. AN641 TaxID=3133443 RepID=UPI0030BDB66A